MRWIFIFIFLISCTSRIDDQVLLEMLRSDNKAQIIEATRYIGKHRKTHLVKYLLENGANPRVSHDLRYKGMSIYQIKMKTMWLLTEKAPPKRLSRSPDSVILKFYYDISKKNGWIK